MKMATKSRRYTIEERTYLVECYIAHKFDRVLAVDDFIQKYPGFDPPPSFSTPKRLYDKLKSTGDLQDRPHNRKCSVSTFITFKKIAAKLYKKYSFNARIISIF